MSVTALFQEFVDAVVNLDEKKVLKLVEKRLEVEDPISILNDLKRAAEVIGEKYEKGEYFVADLIVAGELMKAVFEVVKPVLKKVQVKPVGKIVIGTVEGDIHDIGKNIFITLAEAAGFEIIDLGVDVPPSRFVRAVKEHAPDIVGMSGLLTISIESMKKTIDALKNAGLRDKVKVIIGGSAVSEIACNYVGANAYSTDALQGVKICLRWIKERVGS
ncbi:MAG: corrinoid protein [Sulfolobales archaeon]|nr:corrinoid protein [Sulfolobales archaeon]